MKTIDPLTANKLSRRMTKVLQNHCFLLYLEYQNSQLYSECQLVTALNALFYFTRQKIETKSELYEYLVDIGGGRTGSIIGIEEIQELLGLGTRLLPLTKKALLAALAAQTPVEVELSSMGSAHSCLIIDYVPILDQIQIVNLPESKPFNGFLPFATFEKLLDKHSFFRAFWCDGLLLTKISARIKAKMKAVRKEWAKADGDDGEIYYFIHERASEATTDKNGMWTPRFLVKTAKGVFTYKAESKIAKSDRLICVEHLDDIRKVFDLPGFPEEIEVLNWTTIQVAKGKRWVVG